MFCVLTGNVLLLITLTGNAEALGSMALNHLAFFFFSSASSRSEQLYPVCAVSAGYGKAPSLTFMSRREVFLGSKVVFSGLKANL